MAVIVLAVHNMCTPGKQSDVLSDFFELFRFSVDDDDRILCGIGKIDLLILSIRRCCFQLDVHADPDTARGPETVHVVDVNEAACRTDDECLACGKINTSHVLARSNVAATLFAFRSMIEMV